MKPTLLVIDVFNLARAMFHAVPPLTSPDGKPINAVKGFLSCLAAALDQFRPDELILAMEGSNNWRFDIYPGYKASRRSSPEDFKVQIPTILKIAEAAGWTVITPESGEADDVLAAAVKARPCHRVLLYTSDKDARGLVNADVSVVIRKVDGSGMLAVHGPAEVKARFGVEPSQMRDLLALIGDTSDDVPGVPNIGEKTAQRLLAKYGSGSGIYENLAEISKATKAHLEAGKGSFEISSKLIALDETIPVPVSAALPGLENNDSLSRILRNLGLNIPARRLLFRESQRVAPVAPAQAELDW